MRNQLTGIAQALDDERIKNQIYAPLGPEFYVTITYQQNLPEGAPLQDIIDAIYRDERMRAFVSRPQALYTNIRTNGSSLRNTGKCRTNCQRNTHSTKECWAKKRRYGSGNTGGEFAGAATTNLNSAVKCFHCGELGHVIRDCAIGNKGRKAHEGEGSGDDTAQ